MGFEGRPSRHRKLLAILHREFEGLILKPDRGIEGLGPTLNDIWTGGKRLIICYGDKHIVNGKTFLSICNFNLSISINLQFASLIL